MCIWGSLTSIRGTHWSIMSFQSIVFHCQWVNNPDVPPSTCISIASGSDLSIRYIWTIWYAVIDTAFGYTGMGCIHWQPFPHVAGWGPRWSSTRLSVGCKRILWRNAVVDRIGFTVGDVVAGGGIALLVKLTVTSVHGICAVKPAQC